MRNHVVALLLSVLAGSALASCNLAGTYVRVQHGLLPATLVLSQAEGGFRLALDAYGPSMYDGNPTVGSPEGLATARGGNSSCTALLVSTEDGCSLKVTRATAGVNVSQAGSSLTFGAGVEAFGFYRRKSKP